jgi:hypothetical protein
MGFVTGVRSIDGEAFEVGSNRNLNSVSVTCQYFLSPKTWRRQEIYDYPAVIHGSLKGTEE